MRHASSPRASCSTRPAATRSWPNRLRTKTADKRNNTAAVFAHFRMSNVATETMAGCISVHLATDGWFWIIPLPEGTSSVGFVGTQKAFKARGGNPGDLLFERIRQSPTVSARMRAAELASRGDDRRQLLVPRAAAAGVKAT